MKSRPVRDQHRTVPLRLPQPVEEICLELLDHSIIRRSAVQFFGLRALRDPHAQAARLADQFVTQNRALLSLLEIQVEREYDGRDVGLVISSGSAVGAIPLFSPTTARPDFGIVIQPRFPWAGIGPMLADMGWRVAPTPLRLPLLRRSERRVPVWVLAFMILTRLKALLDSVDRRFEITSEVRNAPRGTVHWAEYAGRSMARGAFLSVPCSFPDLRDDRLLKGAVRHALERQLRALETQKEQGGFVHRLIDFGNQLLSRVRGVPVFVPSPAVFRSWIARPLRSEQFLDGLQSIEWTIEECGLAGLSDLQGIPWTMPMETFFEAWVETVFRSVAQRTGAQIRVGRNRETTHPIRWDPAYAGSQKSLVPDIWLEWESATLIVDAKYKRHWEELQPHTWRNAEEELREQHRHDLLQVLAYANLARTAQVIVCLAYPCSPESWASLEARGRLIHRAELTAGSRVVQIWLTAVPMCAAAEKVALPLSEAARAMLGRAVQAA